MGFYPFSPVVPSGALIAAALAGQTIPGTLTVAGVLTTTGAANIQASGSVTAALGNLATGTAGAGLIIKGGANAKIGSATLVAGTVTVADTAVTANSKIFITDTSEAGTVGTLAVSAIAAGTSFTVTSSNVADTSTFNYLIVEQS